MTLSILITHYNRPDALLNCIKNIYDQHFDFPFEIIVSDDNSSTENLKKIEALEQIKLIQLPMNTGLGANINRGIKACSGDFILYCQEDFFINSNFKAYFKEMTDLLEQEKLQMIRLVANYKFPLTYSISNNVTRIPKLSLRNFLFNAFQYSDHPFVVKNDFYEKYGYYLENVKGSYCETEYAIRMMKSKVNIGILKNYAANSGEYQSVLNASTKTKTKKNKKTFSKKLHATLRAIRQHLEYIVYDFNKRKLTTYKHKSHNLKT